MAVRIRLQRKGARHMAFFRIVATDTRAPRDGRFIEQLGYYDPLRDPPEIKLDTPKVIDWLSKGAQPSETVRSLLRRVGVLETWHEVRKGRPLEELGHIEDEARKRIEAQAAMEKRKKAEDKEAGAADKETKADEKKAGAAEEKAPAGAAPEGEEEAPKEPPRQEKPKKVKAADAPGAPPEATAEEKPAAAGKPASEDEVGGTEEGTKKPEAGATDEEAAQASKDDADAPAEPEQKSE